MAKNKLIAGIMEDLVQKAMFQKVLSSTYPEPGGMILNLGPVKRQILKELKSEDIQDVRPDSFDNT